MFVDINKGNLVDNSQNEVIDGNDIREGVKGIDRYGDVIIGTFKGGSSEEIEILKGRVRELEADINDLNGQIDVLNGQIDTLTGENSELKEQKADLQAQVAAKESEIETLNATISTLQQEIEQKNKLQNLTVTRNGTYTPTDGNYAFSEVNVNVPIPEGGDFLDARKNLSYYYSTVGTLPSYAFAYTPIVECELPETRFGAPYMFYACTNLKRAVLPKLTSLSTNAFFQCTNLEGVEMPEANTIMSNAFYNCTKLKYLDLPNCVNIGTYAFQRCTSISFVNLPNCTTMGNQAFEQCSALTNINLPKIYLIASSVFKSCNNLSYVNLGSQCSYIYATAFYNCTRLNTIVLNYPNVVSMNASASTVFGTTVISSIYVPESLVDAYKTNNQWMYYSDRVLAI